MNLEHYSVFTTDFQDYEFYSKGPRGRIKKVVRYRRIENDPVTYNLAFGDENDRGVVSDTVISDNQDKDMVLSTVANTINIFVIIMVIILFTPKAALPQGQGSIKWELDDCGKKLVWILTFGVIKRAPGRILR